MKKIYLLLTLIVGTLSLTRAQVIVRSDFGSVGDSIWYGIDTTFFNTVPAGTGGSGMTWDYTTGIQADVHDLKVMHDSSFDQAAPNGTNLILSSDYDGMTYYKMSDSSVKMIVSDPLGGLPLFFRIADFPMAYGKQFNDVHTLEFKGLGSDFGVPIDSIWVTVDLNNMVKCDASGTLKTWSGTYNVIRCKNSTAQHVVVKGKGTVTLGQWVELQTQDDTTRLYTFLGKNSKYFIAQLEVDSNNNINSIQYLESAGNATALKGIAADLAGMSVFPNPAVDQIAVTFPNITGAKTKAMVMDMSGRTLIESEEVNGNRIVINTSSLNNGAYMVVLSNAAGKETSKLIINR